MNNYLNTALEYAKKGWHVFPCKEGAKTPLTKHGFKDATLDTNKIKEWWKEHPKANIAISTGKISGITVLDVDKKYNGHITLKDFDVPHTPYATTGSGGSHYYFKYSKECKTGVNRVGIGLDIRNDGGYVIAPPSMLSGKSDYVWNDEDEQLADSPEWLKSSKFIEESKKFEIPTGAIPQGQQDDTLFRFTCSLRHKNFTPGMIRSALKEIISDPFKCPQDPNNIFTDKDIERWILGAFKYSENEDKKPLDPIINLNPVSVREFKELDIPPVEFYLDALLQKKGRTMISAKSNMGKSFFLLNMLSNICRGENAFLHKFDGNGEKPNVLYFELEMGESSLQERFNSMGSLTDLDNLYVQCMYGWDMLNKEYQVALEDIIKSKKIHIIAFDPLGSLWSGDENKREQVKELTDYFDYLLGEYGVSICITHHWRKSTKDFKQGGEMAAGSYGWTKWLDNHVTLHGDEKSGRLIVSCDKSRNRRKWEQFNIALNQETLEFEYQGDFKNTKKFTDEDLLGLFNSFKTDYIFLPDLVNKGSRMCSKTTIYRLLEDSIYLAVDKNSRPHKVMRKETQKEVEWTE